MIVPGSDGHADARRCAAIVRSRAVTAPTTVGADADAGSGAVTVRRGAITHARDGAGVDGGCDVVDRNGGSR